MFVQRFIQWCETANSRQRAGSFAVLARSLADPSLGPNEREATLVSLHLVVDDPSPKVRLVVAEELGASPGAPRSLVRTLLLDTAEIALRVAASPALTATDLIEVLSQVSADVQSAIASRSCLPAAVAAALASSAPLSACRALAINQGAALTPNACRDLARRFGGDPMLRAALCERDDVPADVRQILILEAGRCLETSAFVLGAVGAHRSRRVAFEACERATSKMGEWVQAGDIPELVEHLRATGQISPAFLIRAVCAGNIDLLAASLTTLSGLSARRVRAVVVDCREKPFLSLARSCGLDDATATLLRLGVQEWKDVATGPTPRSIAQASEDVMQRMLSAYRGHSASRADMAITSLLGRLEGEVVRESMRERLTQSMAA